MNAIIPTPAGSLRSSIFLASLRLQKCLAILVFALGPLASACSKPFPEGDVFDMTVINRIVNPTGTTSGNSPNLKKYIFVSAGTHNGNFATDVALTGATWDARADDFCAKEKNTNFSQLPGAGTEYKAMLVGLGRRVACTSSNCGGGAAENLNWVLAANTDYYRYNATADVLVVHTNAAGIFVFGALSAPISTNAWTWYTGLGGTNPFEWTVDQNCNGWTDSTGVSSSAFGAGNATSLVSLSDGGVGQACSITDHILCVRQ